MDKSCNHCGSDENLMKTALVKRKDGSTNQRYMCRECNTVRLRKYRRTDTGKVASAKAIRRYEARNPVRRKAWTAANKIPLKPCEKCGKSGAHRHHPDINNYLLIVFLCPAHHKQEHRNML